MDDRRAVLHRATGAFGELVLRVAPDGHHEVISDGTFLMDTRDGRSERGLVAEALAVATAGRRLDVLVGGLGVGFSLGAALASPLVGTATVVEVEQAVVDLVRRGTGAITGAHLDDPRVALLVGDLVALLDDDGLPTVDVICLDVDNGPGWTLSPANARLYDDDGLAALGALLRPGGVLAVWSAHDDDAFASRLASAVGPVETHRYPVGRGEPDVVWVARSGA